MEQKSQRDGGLWLVCGVKRKLQLVHPVPNEQNGRSIGGLTNVRWCELD
jgi:hypothetical protein